VSRVDGVCPSYPGHQTRPPFRPLKAVAGVRIPSGLPWKTAADQACYYHQPASISSDRPSGTREGRKNSRLRCLRQSPRSADFACPTWARVPAELRSHEVDLVWDRTVHWQPATPRRDDQASLLAEGATDTSATAKHVRSALRTRDVDRSSRSLAASRTSPLSRNWRREMTNELDRLLTITDLSEMLGVPVDTLYGWRHRGEGPAGYRIGRHVRYRRAAVEAWLDTRVDRLQR
jgi:excisionase family DNA binding protein